MVSKTEPKDNSRRVVAILLHDILFRFLVSLFVL